MHPNVMVKIIEKNYISNMNLLTVDESARLNANMVVQMDGMLDEILDEKVQQPVSELVVFIKFMH